MVLLDQYDKMQEETATKFFELDNLFHTHIYQRAGKGSVLITLNSSSPAFSRFRFLTFLRDKSLIDNLCHLHLQIVEALDKKDVADLPEIVRNHNFSGLNGIEGVRAKHPDYFEQ
jgi:DNA-binding GntR family transcriptional regulator